MSSRATPPSVTDLCLLTLTVLVTRVAFRSHYLYDIDSVNFALGMRRFDPSVHQPHPPGYFLYVLLGRFVNGFFHDANAALVAISIAAACGAVVMIYLLTANWFGRNAAVFAGLIFVFSPLMWFHGTVALTYMAEGFFSALAGYLCWRVYGGAAGADVPAAIAIGIGAGFRPSFLLFLGPLLLFSIAFAAGRSSRLRLTVALAALALTLAAWFGPMVSQSGGMNAWWSSLISLWRIAPARQTVFNSNPAISVVRLISIAGIGLLCFGCAVLFAFRRNPGQPPIELRKKVFIWVWAGPGLLFFTFIFLRFVNSGYLLVISPPGFAWLGLCASRWYANPRVGRAAKTGVVSAFAAANSLIFLFAPVYCSYASVRHFEAELQEVARSIPRIASPADTMIVGFDSHYLGYRHAGYYLPDWYTAQYPEVRLASGVRVFAMEHGDTRLAATLPAARFRNFVFFPLPGDDPEYRDYMVHIRARFPQKALRSVRDGGREFLVGAVADLPLLFPATASRVCAAGDAVRGPVAAR